MNQLKCELCGIEPLYHWDQEGDKLVFEFEDAEMFDEGKTCAALMCAKCMEEMRTRIKDLQREAKTRVHIETLERIASMRRTYGEKNDD